MADSLTLRDLGPLFDFIGYGNPAGPVWFLGPEEAGDLGTFEKRLAFSPIEDLRDAHVAKLCITKHHSSSGPIAIQPTWSGMCHVMLRLAGEDPSLPMRKRYQAERLGRFDDETFLVELLPLPNNGISTWVWGSTNVPELKSRRAFEDNFLEECQERLRRLINVYRPRLVVSYGRAWWTSKVLPVFVSKAFTEVDDVYVGRVGETLVVNCRHFAGDRSGSLTMKAGRNRDKLVYIIEKAGYVHAV